MNKQILTTHEILYKALIFSVNEGNKRPIEGAFERIKGIWYFINSKNATIDGKEVEKLNRSLYVNPDLTSLSNKIDFFEREVSYCGTRNNLSLSENDFINDFIKWIDKQLKVEGLPIEHERKYNDFKAYLFAIKTGKKDNEVQSPQTLKELFIDPQKYEYCLNALCNTDPPLLINESGQYRFIGNPKTQIGIVGYYFKELKDYNILKQLNSKDIAEILSSTIKDFKIKESTIKSETAKFSKVFRKQLEPYYTQKK